MYLFKKTEMFVHDIVGNMCLGSIVVLKSWRGNFLLNGSHDQIKPKYANKQPKIIFVI